MPDDNPDQPDDGDEREDPFADLGVEDDDATFSGDADDDSDKDADDGEETDVAPDTLDDPWESWEDDTDGDSEESTHNTDETDAGDADAEDTRDATERAREYADRASAVTRAYTATAGERAGEHATHAYATMRAYTAAAAEWTRESGLPWCRHQLQNIRTLPSRAKRRAIMLALGPSDTIGTRLVTLVMVVALGVLAAGGLYTLSAGLDTSADSSWFMARFIGTATSVWTYAGLMLVLILVVRATERRRRASKAASRTGFSTQTVARLAAEARTADGSSTVVVSPADTVESAAERITNALESPYEAIDVDWGDQHVLDDGVVDAAETSAAGAEEDALVLHDRANADPEEHAHLTRLEIASTLDFDDVLWNFAIPAVVTAVIALVLVQFWAPIWMYGLIVAGSVVAGTAWYVGTHSLRRRRVQSVRQPDQPASYSDIAVLVKKVETNDVTAYYGWVDGECYADYNELRLAWTLAEVAHARIEGEPKPPTIQQKFARNLKQYLPNLKGYEEAQEKREIKDRLIQMVAATDSNRLPKNRLADRVIASDKQRIGGIGYDPRLVASIYDDITPYALVETTAEVDTATEGKKEMEVVRLRIEEVQREAIETDAQYSSIYQPDYEPDFNLPEVSMDVPEASM